MGGFLLPSKPTRRIVPSKHGKHPCWHIVCFFFCGAPRWHLCGGPNQRKGCARDELVLRATWFRKDVAVGQHQRCHFGVGESTAHFGTYLSGWTGMCFGGTIWILTHGHVDPSRHQTRRDLRRPTGWIASAGSRSCATSAS